MIISLIAAMGKQGQLGIDQKIPWHVKSDFQNFKKLTMGHHLVMGRKTFESIGRPLPGRITAILTRKKDYKPQGAQVFHTIDDVVHYAKEQNESELFVCGGAEIYKLFYPIVNKIYLSRIDYDGQADTYFPYLDLGGWNLSHQESFQYANELEWNFEIYNRV